MFLPMHVKVRYGQGLCIKKITGSDNKDYIDLAKV